jgi:hypothetical protein
LHAKEADSSFPMQSLWTVLFCTYYVGTRGKTTEEIERLVNKIENIPEINKKAAKKRGEQVSVEADDRWRNVAREMAFAIRKEEKGISQSNLAKRILNSWPEGGGELPFDSLSKNLIRPIYQCEKLINKCKEINPEITRAQLLTKIYKEWPHKNKPSNFENLIRDVIHHRFDKE